ncbi:hypothetical protein [Alicyclobacillus dauci]|uniref:Lipoprotein n=1 Tax=Alicyclobacillus dauci TaxID=1475485 RepID=A0ABY6Z3N5_9BACL|nr:hypothetical protein [Alicyclobacillus dauci]WAH37493.1 hypothetical protein NZD86_02860 [Alicyclobacillus dauci]
MGAFLFEPTGSGGPLMRCKGTLLSKNKSNKIMGSLVGVVICITGCATQTQVTHSVLGNANQYLTQPPNDASNVQVEYSREIGQYDYVIASYDKGSQHLWSEIIGRRIKNGGWDQIGMISTLPSDSGKPLEILIMSMPANFTMIGGVVNDKSIIRVKIIFHNGNTSTVNVNSKTGAYCFIFKGKLPLGSINVEGYNSEGKVVYIVQR